MVRPRRFAPIAVLALALPAPVLANEARDVPKRPEGRAALGPRSTVLADAINLVAR